MEVIMGSNIGFCKGVSNAVEKSIELVKNYGKVYALGMLIHNEKVINSLEKLGIIFVDDIDLVPNNEHLIFRTHGETKNIYERAKNKNLIIHDLTCPNVLNIHKKVQELNSKGYFIVLCGYKNHPEVIATMSYCEGIVVYNIEDIVDLKNNKIALICQTTISLEKFDEIKNYLIKLYPSLLVFNTVCNATKKREDEVIKLSSKVDNLLIIGSNKSSNTKKLFNVSKCSNTYFVDDVDTFNKKLDGVIGIVTGASTPVEDAIKLKKIINNK